MALSEKLRTPESLDIDGSRIDLIARVAHDANRAYCEAINDFVPEHWHRIEDEDRHAKRQGVIRVLRGATAAELHKQWAEHKLLGGWRYGKEKDELQKLHPCLLPYEQLPAAQRYKDTLFASVVKALS